MEIVSAVRKALADRVGNERFKLWFGAGTRFELRDRTLVISAPNQFFRDWLISHFGRDLEAACQAAVGRSLAVEFITEAPADQGRPCSAEPERRQTLRDTSCPAHPSQLSPSPPQPPTPSGPPQPDAAADSRSVRGGSGPCRPRPLDFDAFVVGPSNRLARAAAEMAVERPGELSPLVICGPTSVGKTHLLEAICHAARRARPGTTAIYLTAEQFTAGFLQALRGSGLPSFRQKYRGVDLLAVDDLQFFCGKRCTQKELQYTIDTMVRERRQIVFAVDRPLAELTELGTELSTRLQGGMVCRIEPPDYDTRLGILAQMAKRFAMHVPDDVQAFIASHLTTHARELSGALCRLRAMSEATHRPIDLAMAEEALADLIRPANRLIRLPDIAKAVCETFGLEPRSLQSAGKARCISHPRMLAMWLARKYTRAALSEIGQYFGGRSHSTVISAQKRVERWLSDGQPVELADIACTIDEAIRKVEQRLLAG